MATRKRRANLSKAPNAKKIRGVDVTVEDISQGSSVPGRTRQLRESASQIAKEPSTEKGNLNKQDETNQGVDQSDGLSDYERMRLENIQKNIALFEELNLSQAKFDLSMTSPSTTKVKQRGLSRPKKSPQSEPALPTRQSLRLQNKDPTGVTLPDSPKNNNRYSQPVDEHLSNSPRSPWVTSQLLNMFLRQQPRFKTRTFRYFPQRVKAVGLKNINSVVASQKFTESPRKVGPLKMKPCNSVEESDAQEFIDELTVLANMLQKSTEREDDIKSIDVNSYKRSLQGLKIREEHVAKLVPNRIFSIAFHPAKYKTLVFAGDKWGHLGIWDVGSSKGDDGVYLYAPHSRPVNCMSFDPDNCGKLYTASYDGTMRCCDVASATFQEVYTFDDDDSTRLMHFAFGSPSTSTILAATDTGYVIVVDPRTNRKVKLAEQSYCLHDKTVKCIDVHPLNQSLFLTASNDGSVAFWDLRNVKSMKSKLSSLHRTRVATSAYFSPQTGSQVLVTSLDDYVTINQVDSCGKVSSSPKCCFRHDNQTGRWLTTFRATWDPKFDSYAVVGSMRQPRQIDIFSSEIKSSALMHLTHENLNSINSLNVFHPSVNKLAGANSSGKVYLWTE